MIGGTNLLGIFSAGKPAIEPELLSIEHFKSIRTPQECAALLKHAVEVVKSNQYLDAALRVVLRIASERPSAGAEMGDFGVCSLLDSVLGQKMQDPSLCRLTLEIILLLIAQKGVDIGVQSQQRSLVLAAVAGMVGSTDGQTNVKRLTSSATIFRIIKACHTHCTDAAMILLGLKSLHFIVSETGESQKLVSCGMCDLLGLILRHHYANEDIVILVCQCVNELVLFDLDQCDGSLGCQDKLSDSLVCDILMEKVLREKVNSSTEILGSAMKAIGTLARRHPANKEQLALSGACEVIPAHCSEENIRNATFAANACWFFANLSFPDENNQSRLGSAGACEIVVHILKKHVDEDLLIQEGCRALHQLGELHDENLKRFCDLGSPGVCMHLLRKYIDRDDVLQWVMYALATLAGSQHGLALMQQLDIEESIVDVASRYVANEDLVQWTSMTIASLCDSERMVAKLHELHCCQVLLQALGRHLNNPDVCEEVLRAMGSVAVASMSSRHTLSENSVADFVVKTLEQHPNCETVIEQGLFALSSVLYVSREGASLSPGISISRAVAMGLDRGQHRVYKAMTYACLLNGGMKLLCRSITKFSEQNTTLTSYGVKLLCSLALGCKLLDVTRGDGNATANPHSDGESSTSRLGAAGAVSAFSSVMAHHLQDKNLMFWCLFGLVQLAVAPNNLALLGAADICTAVQRMLDMHLGDADLLALLFELIIKLCVDANCRSILGVALSSQPGEPHHQLHIVVKGIRLHLSVDRVVAAGCGALSALCISPNSDALSSLFYAQEATRTLRVVSSTDQDEPIARRSSGAGPTDWTTFGENVDHLNSVLPAENTEGSDGTLTQDSPQSTQPAASLASNLIRRLSFWSSKKSDQLDTSTTPTQRSSTPSSASYDQVHHQLHSRQQPQQHLQPPQQYHYHASGQLGTNISGQQFIMEAANSIISTGLSDQEERVIKALRQRATQRKTSSDSLAEGGAFQVLLQILQSCNRSDFPYSLALALNALNSLCLHTPNRLKARELGLFETLAAVHARVAGIFGGDGPRDLCGLEFDQLDESDWVRVQVVLSTIALGTCCLPDTLGGDNVKTVEQIAIVHTNQEVLGSLSVLENIALCLSKSAWDVHLCEVALRSLHLIVRGNESNQTRILTAMGGEQTVLYHVVNALREKMDAAPIAYHACLAIAAIATDSKDNCDRLEEHGVCKAVLRTLVRYMDHDDVVEAACQAIHGLKPLNEALGQGGACEFVVRTLEVHASSPSVSEWVCRAIGSLAESKFNKIELEKHQITKIVTATLQRHVASDGFLGVAFSKDHSSAGVAQWGCTAIYYLAKGYDAEGFQKRLVQAGACDAVARALTKYAEVEAVAYSCCRALVVLVDQNEALKSKPLLSSVCQYIVEALHLFPSSVLMAKWGCRAAAVLAESHETNIAKLGAAGACESIPLIIQSHPASEEVAVAGCKLIAFMSEQTSNGFAARFGHSGACEAVVAALRKHMASSIAAARASIAINTLAMVVGNARWFGPAGACDALHAALQLHMGNARVAKFIVSAIGQLCIIEHNKERLGVLGVCEAVVQTAEMHAEDLDTAQSCADTIGKLCEVIGKAPANLRPLMDSMLPDAVTSDAHFLACRRNRAVLFNCGACKFLVRALENHLADVNAAQCICKAISIVASGESCSREAAQMGSLGACQAISKAMTFHEGVEEVAMYSCFAVHALCMVNDSNKLAFHNAAVCPLVVQVLRGFRHSPVAGSTEAAARAISALSASCVENKTMLGQAGGCEGLLECLELHMRSQELTFLLLKALFHVCDGSSANRTRVSFSGAPDILHSVLTRYLDEEKMVDYTLSTMIGLSLDKVGQSKLGAVGVPKTLAAIMFRYDKSDHVSTLSLALVGAMCKGSRANQDKFGGIGIAKLIAASLSRYRQVARSEGRVRGASLASGTRALRLDPLVEVRAAVVGSHPDEEADAEDSSVLASSSLAASPVKVHAQDADCTLVDYMGEVCAVKESCRALYYFCMDHEANRQRMLALGVMDLLTALVSKSMLGGADGQQDLSDQTKVWARNAMEVLMATTRG